MTKITLDRAVVEQALEALEWIEPSGLTGRGGIEARNKAITNLRAALAQDQLHDQQLRDDAERWRNIRGYVKAMEDEICALRSSLRAALAEPVQEPATLPGPGLVMCPACCSQFDPALNRVEPVPDPDSPERRCGGPGCDMRCCQPAQGPVADRAAFERHAERLGYSVDPDTREGREGGYWSSHTQLMWLTWQAAMAQRPAEPVEPVAWLRVIDEAMVTHHLGVADPADDYETAKRKMNNLLCMAQDIGTYFAKQAASRS